LIGQRGFVDDFEGEAEKRMDGLPADIQRRDPCRRKDNRIANIGLSFDIIDEGRFACPRLARNKNGRAVIGIELF